MNMQILIKPTHENEVEELRQIAIKTFTQTYEHLNNPSVFKQYINSTFTSEKLIAEIRNKESTYYLVTLDNKAVGYLKLNIGGSQTENYSEEYLEIERIYLDSNYQRRGIGKRMIDFAFDKAKELQKSRIWLGVWDQNPNAIQFYENMGFEKNGSHIFKFGDEDQTDITMEMRVPL